MTAHLATPALITRINVELANDLGNLAQRSLSLIARNCERRAAGARHADRGGRGAARPPPTRCRRWCATRIDRQVFHEALEEVWKVIRAANAYIDHQAPWALNKTDHGAHGARCCACWWTCCAPSRRCCSRSCRTAWRSCWTSSVCRRDARMLAALATPLAEGTPLPAPAGRVPALCRSRRRKSADADRFSLPSGLFHARRAAGRAGARGGGRRGRDGDHRHPLAAIAGHAWRWRKRTTMSGAPSASIRTTRRELPVSEAGDAGGAGRRIRR